MRSNYITHVALILSVLGPVSVLLMERVTVLLPSVAKMYPLNPSSSGSQPTGACCRVGPGISHKNCYSAGDKKTTHDTPLIGQVVPPSVLARRMHCWLSLRGGVPFPFRDVWSRDFILVPIERRMERARACAKGEADRGRTVRTARWG